jgi:hypothetical protein
MTAKRNITVAIDAGLLKKARVIAAQRGSSVSGLLADHLRSLVEKDDEYERCHKRALELMETPMNIGGPPLSREEVNDRTRLRR